MKTLKTLPLKSALFLLVSLLFPFIWGCNSIQGSGVEKTEKRQLSEFSGVELSGAYSAQVTCGKTQEFELTGDDNLVPLIKTEVANGQLKVYCDQSISPTKTLRLRIAVNSLKKLSINGAGETTVSELKGDQFAARVNGAGNLTLSGETKSAEYEVNGAAKIEAQNLKAAEVKIELNGAGKAAVFATDKLKATVNGVGDIDYSGDPKDVQPVINGLGKINKK